MFTWLRRRVAAWAERYQQRESDRLLAEGQKLKAEVLRLNGGEPIRQTPEQKKRLDKLRRTIDPEVLKRIDLLAHAE